MPLLSAILVCGKLADGLLSSQQNMSNSTMACQTISKQLKQVNMALVRLHEQCTNEASKASIGSKLSSLILISFHSVVAMQTPTLSVHAKSKLGPPPQNKTSGCECANTSIYSPYFPSWTVCDLIPWNTCQSCKMIGDRLLGTYL